MLVAEMGSQGYFGAVPFVAIVDGAMVLF